MMRRRKQRDARRGSAFIEFSLVFGLFLAFTAGIFELGRAIWNWSSVAHAVKEGVRFASMHGVENPADAPPGAVIETTATDAAIKQIVKNNAVGLSGNNLTVEINWSGGGLPGTTVTVEATYPFSMIAAPLLGKDMSGSLSLSRSSSATVVN